jgi:two-component system chemotaxis response regulator CheY
MTPSIRDLLAEELRCMGYSVVTARNGSEALDRLHVMTPDVIVLDLMMPVMDGWTFVERYRESAGRRSVPIIAVSAEGDLPPGYDAHGVAAFLRKPFDLTELGGLHISREIVLLHGGTITAAFPSDGGSQFTVRLPPTVVAPVEAERRYEGSGEHPGALLNLGKWPNITQM